MENNSIINVSTVIHFTEAHLTEKLDLDIVAHAVHYSKYHLHRVFTNTVGLTLHDYVYFRYVHSFIKWENIRHFIVFEE